MKDIKNQMLKLKAEGRTYTEIAKIFNCSLSRVHYYCILNRDKRSCELAKRYKEKNPLIIKIKDFLRGKSKKFNTKQIKFNTEQLIKKIGNNPICYLTGQAIDLNKPETYSLDHIIPLAKGGSSTIENVGLTTKEANLAKHDKTPEDFLRLCRIILENNNYNVSRSIV
jgi:5-methylcytosine-specific restriction endonuclease McrA